MKATGGLLYLLLVVAVVGGHRRLQGARGGGGCRLGRDHRDALKMARCEAKCWNVNKTNKKECINKCLLQEKKAGQCNAVDEMNPWDAACVSACKFDAHCPGIQKCCPNRCGMTCQHPRGLNQVPGLPSKPKNVTIQEKRGLAIRVSWFSPNNYKYPVLFVIEERNHFGIRLKEALFGEWVPHCRSLKNNVTLKGIIKPGRWYQFRVAAINENGTKGFTEPSQPFQPSLGPRRPNPPRNLTIDTLQYQNGTVNGILRWKPPSSSHLPIQKYKVYWSRRLQGFRAMSNSILRRHDTVNKDQNFFEVKGLEPKSQYFFQVEVIAQYGATKLKSNAESIVVNITNYSNGNDSVALFQGNSSKRSADQKIEGLKIQNIYWNKGQLLAQLIWKSSQRSRKNIRYSVQWWSVLCDNENKGYKIKKETTVYTDVPQIELYDLNFNCTYRVQVNQIQNGDKHIQRAYKRFTTPLCEQIQMKTKEKIKCD